MAKHTRLIVAGSFIHREADRECVAGCASVPVAMDLADAYNALAGRDPKRLEALVDACIALRGTEQAGLDVAADEVVYALNAFLGEGDES